MRAPVIVTKANSLNRYSSIKGAATKQDLSDLQRSLELIDRVSAINLRSTAYPYTPVLQHSVLRSSSTELSFQAQ